MSGSNMSQPKVTIIITQRERFSQTQTSLESLFANTEFPFKLIYVDGKSPRSIRTYLEQQSKIHNFRLIRRNHYLFPNQARHLALPEVETPYVVFLDNDVEFKQGWLQALVNCAEETGAWLVGPLYCEGHLGKNGPTKDQVIHMAGGEAHFKTVGTKKRLYTAHKLLKQSLAKHQSNLKRQPTEMIEYHCVLMKTEAFETIGFPDIKLLTIAEHIDICMTTRQAGGEVYFEPSAVVSYVTPPPFSRYDIPFYKRRWGDKYNLQSLVHLQQKWNLADDDPYLVNRIKWAMRHRLIASPLPLSGLTNTSRKSWFTKTVIMPLQKQYHKLITLRSRLLIRRLEKNTRSANLGTMTKSLISQA
jgi:GT2 family glycosyltransferase